VLIDAMFEVYKDFRLDENNGKCPKRQEFIANLKNLVGLHSIKGGSAMGLRICRKGKHLQPLNSEDPQGQESGGHEVGDDGYDDETKK
jgi:hypothetical protein